MLLSILLVSFALQTQPDLDTVIKRATHYVSEYEEKLGNLIGAEEYIQNSAWSANVRGYAQVVKRMQRRTSSDFLIIQVGSEWAALRKVNRVDGSKVKEAEIAFEDAFDDSLEANRRRLLSMKAESTEYNIGDIRRDINLPTFGLKVLREDEVVRFSFEKAGEGRIEGIRTWVVRFQEQSGRSLVVGSKGETLYANGRLWIEPETGRVLQTEVILENPYAVEKIRGRVLVTYTPGKNVYMLVPLLMAERYETQSNTVECTAHYSNFRPFEVDVKFEIAPPKPN